MLVCGIRSESTQRKQLSQDRDVAQALQMVIADEIEDSEAKTLHSQASGYTRSTDKVPVVNQVKGKETPPRPSSKPLTKLGKNKSQKVKCNRF